MRLPGDLEKEEEEGRGEDLAKIDVPLEMAEGIEMGASTRAHPKFEAPVPHWICGWTDVDFG